MFFQYKFVTEFAAQRLNRLLWVAHWPAAHAAHISFRILVFMDWLIAVGVAASVTVLNELCK